MVNLDSQKRFLHAVLLLALVAMVFFGLEFFVEWQRLGRPGIAEMSWAPTNNAKLVDVLSPMARAYNNILGMLLATIGLAIPLTANMHTPKLIDLFLRDRVNQVVLTFCTLGAAHVLWVDYLIGPQFAPLWAYRLAVLGAMTGWIVLLPYFFYVVRFLDPSNILARLRRQVTRAVEQAQAGRLGADAAHDLIRERVEQIGTIVLKSIDRGDRGVAVEGIWGLKQVLDNYGGRKSRMPAAWFHVERKDFVGMSDEGLAFVNADRTWLEQRVLGQVFFAYQNALAKTSDVISSLSNTVRHMAIHAAEHGDTKALELTIKFFNNFLREAIKRKEIHAIYDLFYQYRLLAGAMCDRPQVLKKIGDYFRFYSDQAAAAGLIFVPAFAGFDLAWMVCRAYDSHSAAAPDLLDDLLALDHRAGHDPRSLLLKAKVILGGYFVEHGLTAEAGRVRDNLAGVPEPALAAVKNDLMNQVEESFWEVTDRQVMFDWLEPGRRPHVKAFLEALETSPKR